MDLANGRDGRMNKMGVVENIVCIYSCLLVFQSVAGRGWGMREF